MKVYILFRLPIIGLIDNEEVRRERSESPVATGYAGRWKWENTMYKKLIETKVIRTRHEVSFHEGSTAYSIMQDLKEVPPNARLIENDEEKNTMTFAIEIEA